MTPESGIERAFIDALAPLLVRRFREELYTHLQPASPIALRDGTYPLLAALAHGPATAARVSERIGVDRTVISRQATVLIDAGLVARRVDPTDKRGHVLSLTPEGERCAQALSTRLLTLASELCADEAGRADVAATIRTLNKLASSLRVG